jgi:rRNA maturation endonuclease Nob1
MIEITIRHGMLLFSILLVLGTLGLYIVMLLRERGRAWEDSRQRLGHCQACHSTFIIPRHDPGLRCPACGGTLIESNGMAAHGKRGAL